MRVATCGLATVFVAAGIGLPILGGMMRIADVSGPLFSVGQASLLIRDDALSRAALVVFFAGMTLFLAQGLWANTRERTCQAVVLGIVVVFTLVGLFHYFAGSDSASRGLRGLVFFWGLFGGMAAVVLEIRAPSWMRRQLGGGWLLVLVGAFAWSIWGDDYGTVYRAGLYRRWSGFFVNPNVYGAFSALSVVLGVHWIVGIARTDGWFRSPRQLLMLAGVNILLSIAFIGLLASYSRSAWIGAAFGLLAAGWRFALRAGRRLACWAMRHPGGPSRPPVPGARPGFSFMVAASSLAFGLGCALWCVDIGAARTRAGGLFEGRDRSITNRSQTWADAIPMAFDRIGGWGWQGWETAFERRYWKSGQTSAGSIRLNDHLSIALTFGWLIGILWLMVLAGWFFAVFRHGRSSVAGAMIACLLPTSFANNILFNPILAPVWWGFLLFGARTLACAEQPPPVRSGAPGRTLLEAGPSNSERLD